MLVVRKLIHEGEEERAPERIPSVHEDVFVFFGLEERDGMDFDLTECAAVEGIEGAMQMPAQFFVEARDELRKFLLNDGRGQVNIPRGEAGEGRIAREQAVKKRGAAPQVADDEQRLFNRMRFVRGEENVVEPEAEPMEQRAEGPDRVEKNKEEQASAVERGG